MGRIIDGEVYALKFRKTSLKEARKEGKKLREKGYKFRIISAEAGKIHEVWAKWGRGASLLSITERHIGRGKWYGFSYEDNVRGQEAPRQH